MFSCEFCEISKNIFSYRTPPVAAFVYRKFELCYAYSPYALEKIYFSQDMVDSVIIRDNRQISLLMLTP